MKPDDAVKALKRKYYKSEVEYEDPAKKSNHCSMCRHFIARNHTCELVAGIINPKAWCDKFEAK